MKSRFNVDKASYQSWRISETEMGKDIILEISDVPEGIEFQSLVFGRQEVDIQEVNKDNGKVTLKATIQQGKSIVENSEQKSVNKPDQLNFSRNGKSDFVQLSDWERKPTKLF